jgi:hypothetical protein
VPIPVKVFDAQRWRWHILDVPADKNRRVYIGLRATIPVLSSATIASRVIVRNTRNHTPIELRLYPRRSFTFLSLRPFTLVVQPRTTSPSIHLCTSVDIS